MGHLIIAGREVHDFGSKLVNWHQNGWDATAEMCVQSSHPCSGPGAYADDAKNKGARRYAFRPSLRREKDPKHPSFEATQRAIRKFVLHHDGVNSSKVCWNVLHNERGLSCHFLIDNDGTIFQTLDLAFMGFHAAKYNLDSIGVEFCNRGDAKKDYDFYKKLNQTRTTKLCKINGHTYEAWDFTPAQYESMHELAAVLVRHLPELPLEYPTEPGSSKPLWDTMGPIDALGDSIPAMDFKGYIAHYHLTRRKWDPGPFNFQEFVDKLRGQRSFPLWMPGSQPQPKQRPLVPSDPDPKVAADKISKAAQAYTALNESVNGPGGFFPVGPWGSLRLWHGGMHLPADQGTPLHAPFAGRVVAARMADDSAIGSRNFVLLRHDVALGKKSLRFFTLFMHVAMESGGDDAPKWLSGKTKKDLDTDRAVWGFDEAVEAGEVIGHVGVAGPGDLSKAQVHLEIFSRDRLFAGNDDWTLVDRSTSNSRFCDAPEILTKIDDDKDGRLSRPELFQYYTEGEVDDEMRKLITFHVSEWTDEPDWAEELARSLPDFVKKSGKRGQTNDADDEDYNITELVTEQLDPFIWWTEPVAQALVLPKDGTVYHYHPMRFIEKVNLALLDTGAQALDAGAAVEVNTREVTDDASGENMIEEASDKPPDDLHLTIEDLEKGWAGDRPAGAATGGGTP
jgi:hypothetical protein